MVSALEEELRILKDEREILRTLHQYGHAHDYDASGDPDRFLDCFTETAVLYWTVEGKWVAGSGARYAGREALEAFHNLSGTNRGTAGNYTKHFVMDPLIELNGDCATVHSYFTAFREEQDGPLVQSMGRYMDNFVRCHDGRWRIQERHISRECSEPSAG